jgi:glutathione S-transferase
MVVEPGPAGDPELVRAAEAIADCVYVPVLSRFRTYGLSMHGQVAAWEERIWEQLS